MSTIKNQIQKMHQFFLTRKTYDLSMRLFFLKKLKQAILENEKEICSALYKDFRKPIYETYSTEIFMVLSELDFAIKNLKKWAQPERTSGSLPLLFSHTKITPEPFGVCLVFSPFNYPFQLALAPLIGAISAGNCVVIKPSEHTPSTNAIVKSILNHVFPQCLVYVTDASTETAKELLDEPLDYIFFTGSTQTGKLVMQKAASQLIPITLELGGKNPVIVDYTADLKLAAKRIAWGKFLNAAQTCIAPDYVLVHEEVAKPFLKELKTAIQTLYTSSNQMASIINEASYVRLLQSIEEDKVYCGGHFDTDKLFIEPTVLYPVSLQDHCMQEEIFGPILPVIPFQKLSSALSTIRKYPKPLAFYIFSKDKLRTNALLKNISSGGAVINDVILHVVNPNVPFGGVGASGMGRYHGKFSFQTFSHYRSTLYSSSLELPLRYPPYENKLPHLKKFIKFKFKS